MIPSFNPVPKMMASYVLFPSSISIDKGCGNASKIDYNSIRTPIDLLIIYLLGALLILHHKNER